MNPEFLTLADVIDIHSSSIELFGGEPGVRDYGLLESALAMPKAGIHGTFFHATLWEMAAAYLYHLVQNHPFIDGNKRTGVLAAFVFLEINGIQLTASNKTFADMVLAVSRSECDKSQVTEFIKKHSKTL